MSNVAAERVSIRAKQKENRAALNNMNTGFGTKPSVDPPPPPPLDLLKSFPVRGSPPDQSSRGGRKTRRSRRLMSRKYCKKTPCRRMGFTQRASCRPYKNCYRK